MMALAGRLSSETRAACRRAGCEVAVQEARWRMRGDTVPSLLTQGAAVESMRHYPAGDIYDTHTRIQFYFHAHRPGEFGHIHIFSRSPPASHAPSPMADPLVHLIAIGFDGRGCPAELFTTSRWVTGEDWYPASALISLLASCRVTAGGEMADVAQWLTAFVALFSPQVESLLNQRDVAIAEWSLRHPGGDPLDDPRLEIPSRMDIDIDQWRFALDAAEQVAS